MQKEHKKQGNPCLFHGPVRTKLLAAFGVHASVTLLVGLTCVRLKKRKGVHAAECASAYAAFTNACRSIFSLLFKQRQRHTVSFLGQHLLFSYS